MSNWTVDGDELFKFLINVESLYLQLERLAQRTSVSEADVKELADETIAHYAHQSPRHTMEKTARADLIEAINEDLKERVNEDR